MSVKVPKPLFCTFMGPKPHFYGSQKPQIEICYEGPALFKTDPIKKWHFFIRNVRNEPKTHFWVLLWALWDQNPFLWVPKISN